MKIDAITFPNMGFLQFELNQEQLLPIKTEIDKIQNNFNQYTQNNVNNRLIGHLDKEYELIDCREHIHEKIIYDLIEKYIHNFGNINFCNTLTSDVPYTLQNVWVNYQKKHDFNPIHDHSGIFSFVIWIKMPYDIREEINIYNPVNNLTSHFCFHYIDILGMIRRYAIPADKNYQGKGLFFPSVLNHSVNPFYTSDEYRISVSGNIKFKVS